MSNWFVSYSQPVPPGSSNGNGWHIKGFEDREKAVTFAHQKIAEGYLVDVTNNPDVSPPIRLTNVELARTSDT